MKWLKLSFLLTSSHFVNMSGETNWCLTFSKCSEIMVDHPKSRKCRLKNFARKKFKAKWKRAKVWPPYRPFLPTKSGRGLFPIVVIVVVVFRKRGGQRSIFINSDLFSLWVNRFLNVPSSFPQWSHSFELKEITADYWNCKFQRGGKFKFHYTNWSDDNRHFSFLFQLWYSHFILDKNSCTDIFRLACFRYAEIFVSWILQLFSL